MGWTFERGATRRDAIEYVAAIKSHANPDGSTFATLRRCLRGNVVYALHESTYVDGRVIRFIGVYLLQRGHGGWGWKSMDETMGPYYYDCPASYIKDCTAPVNQTAADWRAAVLS